jgi:hypothetical protein
MELLLCNLLTTEQKALVQAQNQQTNASKASSQNPATPYPYSPSAYQPAIDFHTKNIALHTARIGELDQQWNIFVGAVTKGVEVPENPRYLKWAFRISSEAQAAAEVITNTQWAWSREYLENLSEFTSEDNVGAWVEDMDRHSPGCFGEKVRGLSMG